MQIFEKELINKIQEMKNNNPPDKFLSEEELQIMFLASLLEEERYECN